MKRFHFGWFFCLLSLGIATPSWADSKTGFYFSLAPTVTSPTAEPTTLDLIEIDSTTLTEATINGANAKVKMKVGLGINGEFGYKWQSNIRTGVEVGYRASDMDRVESAAGNAIIDGQLEMSTIFLNVGYDFDNEEGAAPYIFGGLGASYHELDLKSVGTTSVARVEDELTFAFQAGAGFYKPLNEFIDAGLGYRYVFSNDQKFGVVNTEMGVHHLELTFRLY